MVGPFLFRRLDRNGSISFKCMVCNHFVALSVRCCVTVSYTHLTLPTSDLV